MEFNLAQHMNLSSFKAMDVMRVAQQLEAEGRSICHLEIGQPATPAPVPARADLRARMDDAETHGYTVALGLPALRERISGLYGRWYGKSIAPERVVLTVGSSLGFIMAMLACFERGARIALPSPGYPAYRNLSRVLGLQPVDVPVDASQNWRLSVEDLARMSPQPDGLILASPANPTGVMLSEDELKDIALWCQSNGVRLISDEIYHGLTYDRPATSLVDVTPDLIVVNSFSKYFSMTGHRIGWMIIPEGLRDPIERLAQNLVISAPTLSQYAALAVLSDPTSFDELDRHVARYRSHRDYLLQHLPAAFLGDFPSPDGAFYLYADITALGQTSSEISQALLAEAGVAATPGIDFDPVRGDAYLRLAYARETAEIEEACRRITAWMAGR